MHQLTLAALWTTLLFLASPAHASTSAQFIDSFMIDAQGNRIADSDAPLRIEVREGYLSELGDDSSAKIQQLEARFNAPLRISVSADAPPLRMMASWVAYHSPTISYIPSRPLIGKDLQICVRQIGQRTDDDASNLVLLSDPLAETQATDTVLAGCGRNDGSAESAPGRWTSVAGQAWPDIKDRKRGGYVVQIRYALP